MQRLPQPEGDGPSSPPSLSSHPLLAALRPLLSLLHPLLSDADAARLLRTSRTTALALLPSYTFTSHTFQPASLSSLRRLRELCLAYQLRITQLALGGGIVNVPFDSAPPHLSPFPPSVTALSFGVFHSAAGGVDERWAAFSAAANEWQDSAEWGLPPPLFSQLWADLSEKADAQQLGRWMDDDDGQSAGPLLCFAEAVGSFNSPLKPGLLPAGLRVLRLNRSYSRPLLPGSLPEGLTFLQCGAAFDQPLDGVLPASLLHLTLGSDYRRPLTATSLTSSLERLRGLQKLHVDCYTQPALPPSLRLLSFGPLFLERLQPHSLPSSLVELHLNETYDHPLPPGTLPSSLRRLTLGCGFSTPLTVGALPEGLLMLRLAPRVRSTDRRLPRLRPGVLPSTLLAVDFTDRYSEPIEAGVIPTGVRWVRLWAQYQGWLNPPVLPPRATCVWYRNSKEG